MPTTTASPLLKYEVIEYTRGVVLGIGGRAFPHFLEVGTPREGYRPTISVEDPSDLSLVVEDSSVDAVYVEGYEGDLALADWFRCIKPGGHLVLANQGIGDTVFDALREVGGYDLIVRDDAKPLLVFQKCSHDLQLQSWKLPKPERKTVCIVRFGGFGDMLQMVNVLPTLKAQGFHVTVMCTPKGQDVIKADPHIDAWFIQDHDQVPNHELPTFFGVMSKKFDRFINLCESVEGTLLAMPGRMNHGWPFDVRHKYMNTNYLEFTSELAGVPYESNLKFYPTAKEAADAKARLLPGGFNVVWALSGSSQHKFYPGQDVVIANILANHRDCRIFLVGDQACRILEVGWEKEPRVVPLSGEISIRDTLALAKVADVVVGCETGVLNAVSFEANRKVVLLSHSSNENLTKHWENTFVMVPPPTLACYPCHRLHYTMEHCQEDVETGAAMCQRLIDPIDVYAAIILKVTQ